MKRYLLCLITLCALLLSVRAFAAAAPEHPGEALLRAGNYPAARDAFLASALTGDLSSQTRLLDQLGPNPADYHILGRPEVLASYLANQDQPDGMCNLGWLACLGIGPPDAKPDYPTAKLWYEKAASYGSVRVLNHLGVLFANGSGVPQNYHEARRLFAQAADRGNSYGMNNLGHLWEKGLGGPQNYDEARRLYALAAALGNSACMNHLGVFYLKGLGVAKDPARAAHWFRRADRAGRHLSVSDSLGVLESPRILVAGALVGPLGVATKMLQRCLREAEALRSSGTLEVCPVCRNPLLYNTSLVTPGCHLTRRGPMHFFCPECLQRAIASGFSSCPVCRSEDNDKILLGVYFEGHPGTPEASFAQALADRNFPLAALIQEEILRREGDTPEAIDSLTSRAIAQVEAQRVAIDRELEEPALLRGEAQRAEAALTEIRGAAIAARERLLSPKE